MNEFKEKIITFRWLKLVFYFMFLSGVVLFLFNIVFVETFFIRNALFSIIFMLFSYISNEVCNKKIDKYFELYNKSKTKNNRKSIKVIDFEKIA